MYGWDTLVLLQHLLDEGLSKTAIAQRLGVSRRVIYHWITTGQLTRDVDAPVVRQAACRATKLDDYTAIIRERLTTYPELSAVRLFAEVKAAGYRGGITQLRDYVARVRPRPEPEPVVRNAQPRASMRASPRMSPATTTAYLGQAQVYRTSAGQASGPPTLSQVLDARIKAL